MSIDKFEFVLQDIEDDKNIYSSDHTLLFGILKVLLVIAYTLIIQTRKMK